MAKAKIELRNVNFIYQPTTPLAHQALRNINLKIADGAFTVLVGQTGSGKSTLVNLIDALTLPTSGQVVVNGRLINNQTSKREQELFRQKIGFVFQFSERQLFAQTVRDDLAFGPQNLGWPQKKINKSIMKALETVQLSPTILEQSPFSLSGGQKRRVAIAGVLAMNPEVLILDEPTAGLDPGGRDEIFELIKTLHRKHNITIILSSHSMDDMAKLAKTIIVMNHGKIEFMGTPREVFNSNAIRLKEIGLDIPQTIELAIKLRERGFDIRQDILTIDEAKEEILRVMRGRGKC